MAESDSFLRYHTLAYQNNYHTALHTLFPTNPITSCINTPACRTLMQGMCILKICRLAKVITLLCYGGIDISSNGSLGSCLYHYMLPYPHPYSNKYLPTHNHITQALSSSTHPLIKSPQVCQCGLPLIHSMNLCGLPLTVKSECFIQVGKSECLIKWVMSSVLFKCTSVTH